MIPRPSYSKDCLDAAPRHDAARPITRIALVGNSIPRRCGLATFTTDCHRALTERYPSLGVDVYAMTDRPEGYSYPPEVRRSIRQNQLSDYLDAGMAIRSSGAELVWLQHEFGIFGGPAGANILALLDEAAVPIIVTFHTVLGEPNDEQRAVMDGLVRRAAALVVMADYGRALLEEVYGADPRRIEIVPHGIPDRPFDNDGFIRRREGMAGRKVIMTFGLLSPNKGIEHMIAALPTIIRCFPRLIYMVVGATHPNLVAAHGETYREKLKDQAARLGVDAHIRWVDEFLGAEELLDLLGVADVYVTPYLNPAQITSGTLAYAVGLGKPVVSTPYVHAREILANDHGRLVPFRDSTALAQQIIDLLSHPDECLTLRRRAYALGRTMIWSRLAETMMKIFERVAGPMVRLAGASEQVGRQTRSFRQAIVGAERPAIDTSHCREEKQRSSFARRTGSVGEICTLGRGEEAL